MTKLNTFDFVTNSSLLNAGFLFGMDNGANYF